MNFFPAEEENNDRNIRQRAKLTGTQKELIRQKKDEGYSVIQISRLLNIPRGTTSSFLSRENNIIQNSEIQGRPKLINEEIGNFLITEIEEDNKITLLALKEKVAESFNCIISIHTICRFLKKEQIIRKKIHIIFSERNSEYVKTKRVEYVLKVNSLQSDFSMIDFVFIDESGFNLRITRNYGRARRGVVPVGNVPASRGRNISLIQAISSQEVVYFELVIGSVNSQTMLRFFNALIRLREPNQMFVMDNAAIHHASLVQNFLSEKEIPVLFLPPYSPFLNPIEHSFSKIKNYVRRETRNNLEELTTAIQAGIEDITSEELANYYRKSRSYFEKCLLRENINE